MLLKSKMNSVQNPARKFAVRLLCSVAVCALLTSCGGDQLAVAPGGGGTGSIIDDQPVVAVGPIDSVTPLVVNNFGFNLAASSQVTVADANSIALRPGMMVRIEARGQQTSGDRPILSLKATPDMIGQIGSISVATQQLVLLGTQVQWDANTRFDQRLRSPNELMVGDFLQIYGYPTGDNRLRATLIERLPSAGTQRITGVVTAQGCDTCASATPEFRIGSLRVRAAGSNTSSTAFPVRAGDIIQANGQLSTDGQFFEATSVERYSLAAAAIEGTRMSVQGVLATQLNSNALAISGLATKFNEQIKADQARFGIIIAPGNLLRAEGRVASGMLDATTVELK